MDKKGTRISVQKTCLVTTLLALLVSTANSQDTETFLRTYADEVIASTKELPANKNLKVEAIYLRGHYTSALVHEGLLSLGTVLGEMSYSSFGRFRGLWDQGAQAAALINVYEKDPREEYLEYLEKVADFFFKYDSDPKQKSRKRNIDQIYYPDQRSTNRIGDSDHLIGPLFLAGAEMIRLYRTYEKPVPKDWDHQ